jgi:hypothetical protein
LIRDLPREYNEQSDSVAIVFELLGSIVNQGDGFMLLNFTTLKILNKRCLSWIHNLGEMQPQSRLD